MTLEELQAFKAGDRIRLRVRGHVWRGIWEFRGFEERHVTINGEPYTARTVHVGKPGRTPRYLNAPDVEIIPARKRWPVRA